VASIVWAAKLIANIRLGSKWLTV